MSMRIRQCNQLYSYMLCVTCMLRAVQDVYMQSLCEIMDVAAADSPAHTQSAVRELRFAVTTSKESAEAGPNVVDGMAAA